MHRWPMCGGRDLPRPAPRQRHRAGVRFSVAGRSAVFRRRRFGPALLREAPRCSCPAVACGDRGVSDSTWAAGLLFGADGVAITVSLDRVRPGMPPRPPRLPHTPRQSRLRCRTPSPSPRAPRTFQKSREAAVCRMRCPPRPRAGAWRIGFDPPPPPVGRAAWRIRAHAGASPAATPQYSRIAQTAIWHLGVAIHELWRRTRAGFPPAVWSHQSVGMAPDHAASGQLPHGRYNSAGTKAAPQKSCYHPCRCCVQGRFSAPSLPDSPHPATCRGRRLRPLPATGR